MIIKRILQLAVLCGAIHLFVYGSTKPSPPPTMTGAPRITTSALQQGLAAPVAPRTEIVCVRTNEVWNFSRPEGATVVEKWRRRGAANERKVLISNKRRDAASPFSDNLKIDTFGRVWTLGREFTLLGRQVGMVPEARWADLGFASLAWWTVTASNSTVVCWQNALLDRDTNTPVSVQAEFFADGRFAFRYDSAIGAEASNIVARVRTGEDEDTVALTEGVTSVSGFVPDIEVLAQIAGGVSNETCEIVSDELRSTMLWDEWTFWANTGTNALYSRTFEVDRQGGWKSYFLSGRGEPWRCGGTDTISEWSLEGSVIEWSDDTGANGTVTASPTGDSLYLPLSAEATSCTITLKASGTGRHASPQPVFLLEYSPRIEFTGGQEIEGNDGNRYCVFTDPDDFSFSLDLSNRPCRTPADDGEVARDGFTLPTEPGVYRLPLGTQTAQDQRPRLMMGPLMAPPNDEGSGGNWLLVILDPWVTYGTPHYGCSHDYPYDWGWFGTWCDCTPEVGSGIDGCAAVDSFIDWYDDYEAEGVVEIGGVEVWRDTAYHVVWACDHDIDEPKRYCPCGCDGDCPHCSCMSADGPSQGSIRFRVGLGENSGGETLGFAWFESEGPVRIRPQLFEVESRPDANVSVRRYSSRVEVTTAETSGRNLVIASLTNGVTISVSGGQGLTALPLHTWEITNVGNSLGIVRLVRRNADGAIREDWTYSCSWQSGEWVWEVADNRTFDPPPRGESVEVINGTNFVFGSDGKLQQLTIETNGEEVVIRTINYDDDGRVVFVDDGTNGCVTIAYDAAGNVSEMTGPEGTLRAAWDENGVMTNLDTSAWNGPTPNANPPLMAPRPRLLGSGGGITVTEAIRHYLNGNGSPITLPFSVVDTSSATPIKFDCVRNFVSSCHEPNDYHVVGTNYFPAIGKPRLIVGDVPVKLDGTITYTGQCNWTFHGTMTGAEDPYDFNAGNRGLLGEALTALGRALLDGRGTPYVFQFSGSVPLDGSGHCGDR